ncbi:MAG: hypothetical protein AAFZ65_10700 [Planctomycetota bacterium]
MLKTLALCLTLAAPLPQDDDPERTPPSAEQVAAAVASIEAAIEAEDADAALSAIQAAIEVPHEDVGEALAEVARDEDYDDVSLAAIDALGRLDHECGVEELAKLHKKQARKRGDDLDWSITVYRALGRTGRVEALDVLGREGLRRELPRRDNARLLAIGNIRHVDSVETLVKLYERVGRYTSNHYDEALQVSIAALTGEVIQKGRRPLQDWWRDNKDDLEISAVPPEIENRRLRATWEAFWNPRQKDDGTR